MNIEAGYRWRAEDPADEFRYLVEVGSNLGKFFYARTKLDAIVGIGNGDEGADAFGNPTSTLEYDLSKLDLTIGYQITKTLGIELGYAPAVWGETTAKGETWTFAITFQPGR
jgi:protein XagA